MKSTTDTKNEKPLRNKLNIKIIKRKSSSFFVNLVIYILLIGFVFVFLYPFLFMIINSFKYEVDLRTINREWVLTSINWQNYKDAYQLLDYPKTLLNTLILVGLSTIGHILSCSFIAYGLARFKFPGNKIVFGMVILSILLPPQILMIPLKILSNVLNMTGTQLPIIIPSFLGFGLKGGLFIFLCMQFYRGLPKSYEESAKLEGCSLFQIYLKIMLPLSRTTMLVVGSLSAIWHWNDYFEPVTYITANGPQILTQKLANIQTEIDMLYSYTSSAGTNLSPVNLACCTLIIIPILIYFFIVQKRFMQGIEFSGLAN